MSIGERNYRQKKRIIYLGLFNTNQAPCIGDIFQNNAYTLHSQLLCYFSLKLGLGMLVADDRVQYSHICVFHGTNNPQNYIFWGDSPFHWMRLSS